MRRRHPTKRATASATSVTCAICIAKDDGTLGYRCPSEPVADYVRKGGDEADTVGRVCVCNGLVTSASLGQIRHGVPELPLVTAGNEVANVASFLQPGRDSYTAADVVAALLADAPPPPACRTPLLPTRGQANYHPLLDNILSSLTPACRFGTDLRTPPLPAPPVGPSIGAKVAGRASG